VSTLALAPSLLADLGGGPTLDEVLTGVWEGLAAHHSQPCPLCGGEMRPLYAAHSRPVAGRCASCESTLA
jgi:hypothetical protein